MKNGPPTQQESRNFTPTVEELDFDSELSAPMSLFEKFSSLPFCVFLDGHSQTASTSSLNRYSYLAADPIKVIRHNACQKFDFDEFQAQLDQLSTSRLPGLPIFQGGMIGFLSYEFNRQIEKIPLPKIDEFNTPVACFGIYDVIVAFDKLDRRAWLISQGWSNDTEYSRRSIANKRLNHFMQRIRQPLKMEGPSGESGPPLIRPQSSMNLLDKEMSLYSDFSKDEFLRMIDRTIEYIRAGDIFQANLSQRLIAPASCSSVRLYQNLRTSNPAPFSSYFDFGDGQIISSSPERLVSVSEGQIETRPIKGTRKRTTYPEADLNTSFELAHSEKDRAENIMIVDLMRNDLSKICDPDSVLVEKLCGIESYENVLHLVSVIRGTLQKNTNSIDIIRALFPGGSITGAPKIRAMEIIAELEPTVRGPYCGSLGYITPAGDMDFNIMIRTITAKGGWWQIPVGGGIVSDSTAEDEYEETWTKSVGMLRSLIQKNSTRSQIPLNSSAEH